MSLSSTVFRRSKVILAPGFRGLSNLGTSVAAKSTSTTVTTPPADPETHTGQTFSKDDYRLARFVDKKKEINTKFAIDLIAEVPPKKVKDRVVSCDGGGGPTGHPRVFINVDAPGNHSCGYCGLRFVKDDHHH